MKICHQERFKIAQSGHTDRKRCSSGGSSR